MFSNSVQPILCGTCFPTPESSGSPDANEHILRRFGFREVLKSFIIAASLGVGTSTNVSCAMAETPPAMSGTWTSTGETAGMRHGPAAVGFAAADKPSPNPMPRPKIVIERQSGRGIAGYVALPDGSKDAFVGVFKRGGRAIMVSTARGFATADVSDNEMEWCWVDNQPNMEVAVCDVMRKTK